MVNHILKLQERPKNFPLCVENIIRENHKQKEKK